MAPQQIVPRGYNATPEEVTALRRRVMSSASPGGLIHPHLKELKDLGPDVAGVDLLSFTSTITTAPVITQPNKQSLPGGFYAELFEIRGAGQKLGTDPELTSVVYFNIKDTERTGNLFSSDIEMGYLVDHLGGGHPLKFDRGLYVFDPGSRIEVKFSVDTTATTGYAAIASETKKWHVLLCFNLYAM